MKRFSVLFMSLFVAACSSTSIDADYRSYLNKKGVSAPTDKKFSHCRGYGCRIVDHNISLDEKDWATIDLIFLKPIKDAEEERERIKKAIAFFEQRVGEKTGTQVDIAGTYLKLGNHQHDCVDESVNTTIYLDLLSQRGSLLYHVISMPQSRTFPFSRGIGPHQTAVIRDKESGSRYAVDSWFHNNGRPPEIVPLQQWFHGWRPNQKSSD